MSVHFWDTITGSKNIHWRHAIQKDKIGGFYKAIHPWIEVFPPSSIHTHAMTKANDAEQEEEELDRCCPVFHKDTQTAFFFERSSMYTERPVRRLEQESEQ